jgi:hypothetical protein
MAATIRHRADITIRVRAISQLFNSFDPSPFQEKDVDDAAERYIVGWARELPMDAPLRIVVHLPPEEAARPEASELHQAFAHYFKEREEQSARDLRELFRIGRLALVIGVTTLIVCLVASQALAPLIPSPTLARLLEESLIIVGWVANWRPIEIYLYEWWPILRRCRLYRRIEKAPVVVRAH